MLMHWPERVENVLIVCHGNICRSPLCEAVLKRATPSVNCKSRGLNSKGGKRAAKKVRTYAEQHGYCLAGHRSTVLQQQDVDWADIIVYMDGGNLKRLHGSFPGAASKMMCLGSLVGLPRIADPNFMAYGEELTKTLESVVKASLALGQKISLADTAREM